MSACARRIADARPQAWLAVTGTITAARAVTVGGGPGYLCRLADGTGGLDLLFLGRAGVAGLVPGARCAVQAMAGTRRGRLTVWNPRYRLMSPENGPACVPAGLPEPRTSRLDRSSTARPVLAPR
jgi:hypothetical protein